MNGLLGEGDAGVAATWVAAAATIVVLGGLLGERRLFAWAQHLLAGLVTGFLALLALHEAIGPRLLAPMGEGGAGRPELWLGLGLVVTTAAAPWLPRLAAAVPTSIAVGAIASFALGGALVGTVLPQIHGSVVAAGGGAAVLGGFLGLAITSLVLIRFLHGAARPGPINLLADAGGWLLLAGMGGWLGYLLVSRVILLVDRVAFLVFDWLGIGR